MAETASRVEPGRVPLAEGLMVRDIALVLMTGQSEANLPGAVRELECVAEPHEPEDLLDAIRSAAA